MFTEKDDQKCLEYEAREKTIHDYNQGIYEAEQRGRLQGEQAVRESTAKNLLAIGISTEIIAQATGLSKEQIEALKNRSFKTNTKDRSIQKNFA